MPGRAGWACRIGIVERSQPVVREEDHVAVLGIVRDLVAVRIEVRGRSLDRASARAMRTEPRRCSRFVAAGVDGIETDQTEVLVIVVVPVGDAGRPALLGEPVTDRGPARLEHLFDVLGPREDLPVRICSHLVHGAAANAEGLSRSVWKASHGLRPEGSPIGLHATDRDLLEQLVARERSPASVRRGCRRSGATESQHRSR